MKLVFSNNYAVKVISVRETSILTTNELGRFDLLIDIQYNKELETLKEALSNIDYTTITLRDSLDENTIRVYEGYSFNSITQYIENDNVVTSLILEKNTENPVL